MPDPKLCVVVIDDAGHVGLRISDAQQVHEATIIALRKRLGSDAVVYEGMRKNAATMKRMLGPQSETTMQDQQLAYFAAAEKNAAWRVRVKFGAKRVAGEKKPQQFISATCRKATAAAIVDEKIASGHTFTEAREAFAKLLPTFCPSLVGAVQVLPIEGIAPPKEAPPPGMRKSVPKPWSPPPRRAD